jgi:tRNA(fMet)-specific endonuclease VapC
VRYLLDTNIISALMRERDGAIARKLEDVGEERVFTSSIVQGELWFGAARKGSERLAGEVRGLFERLAVEPVSSTASQTYGELRAALERAGTPIGPNDLWIAAHALASDATLVTDNEREFGRVPGLRVENWLRAPQTGANKTESGRDDG